LSAWSDALGPKPIFLQPMLLLTFKSSPTKTFATCDVDIFLQPMSPSKRSDVAETRRQRTSAFVASLRRTTIHCEICTIAQPGMNWAINPIASRRASAACSRWSGRVIECSPPLRAEVKNRHRRDDHYLRPPTGWLRVEVGDIDCLPRCAQCGPSVFLTIRSRRTAGEKIGIHQGRALTRSRALVGMPAAVVGPSQRPGDDALMLKLELAI
jgi:hypothetical protein